MDQTLLKFERCCFQFSCGHSLEDEPRRLMLGKYALMAREEHLYEVHQAQDAPVLAFVLERDKEAARFHTLQRRFCP